MNRMMKLILGSVLGVALVGAFTFWYIATREPVVAGAMLPPVDMSETDPAAWKALYPHHYDSYMKNAEMHDAALKYTTSLRKESRLDHFPYMRILWNGMPFSKEYNEARGHVYTVADVIGDDATARVSDKTMLTCMYCKSAEVPGLLDQMGNDFFKTPLLTNKDMFKHPVSCSDCHNPQTMELRITRPALIEAMERRGTPVEKATRQEMRSLVCAQCHVEYFFNPKDSGKVTFPWDKGFEPKDMFAYFQEQGFSDFTHGITGGGMVKAQHPEYEFFQNSTHQKAGLSCADCHMPYMKTGTAKISSHWWTSPMRTYQQSCAVCHKQSEQEMRDRVLYTQDKVIEGLDQAGYANQAAIEAIEKALKTPGADQKLIDEARLLHREAQFYWDLASAENSIGFHNPQLFLKTIADSIDLARQAQLKATQAIAGR